MKIQLKGSTRKNKITLIKYTKSEWTYKSNFQMCILKTNKLINYKENTMS